MDMNHKHVSYYSDDITLIFLCDNHCYRNRYIVKIDDDMISYYLNKYCIMVNFNDLW